jgi:hypothetical protein
MSEEIKGWEADHVMVDELTGELAAGFVNGWDYLIGSGDELQCVSDAHNCIQDLPWIGVFFPIGYSDDYTDETGVPTASDRHIVLIGRVVKQPDMPVETVWRLAREAKMLDEQAAQSWADVDARTRFQLDLWRRVIIAMVATAREHVAAYDAARAVSEPLPRKPVPVDDTIFERESERIFDRVTYGGGDRGRVYMTSPIAEAEIGVAIDGAGEPTEPTDAAIDVAIDEVVSELDAAPDGQPRSDPDHVDDILGTPGVDEMPPPKRTKRKR